MRLVASGDVLCTGLRKGGRCGEGAGDCSWHKAWRQEIVELKDREEIARARIQPLFAIPKKEPGECRVIHELRELNGRTDTSADAHKQEGQKS